LLLANWPRLSISFTTSYDINESSSSTNLLVSRFPNSEFTANVEQDGAWHIPYCAEVPGANGQGQSREECLANLREAITLILDYRREESLRALPPDPKQELVVIG
jgi:predicted RNase H-like HicB family nuclease